MPNFYEDDHDYGFKNLEADTTVAKVAKVASGVSEAPLPLYPTKAPCKPYPVDALGDIMGEASGAIAYKCFVPEQIASQSVLAAACLAAQAHVDVVLPSGQTRPCSLYLVTIARSGDRKSTADNEASEGIKRHESRCADIYAVQYAEWQLKHEVWTSRKAKLKSADPESDAEFQSKLKELGPEPKKPLLPIIQAPDPTIEGLVKNWSELPGSIGLFSAEGGQFVGGHGMMPETRIKTSSALSQFWDGSSYRRIRAGDTPLLLIGRRLCMHLMLQPEIATKLLSDRSLRDQGILSRLNIAAPESLSGQRFYRPINLDHQTAIKRFNDRVFDILQKSPPLAGKVKNELQPRVLKISPSGCELLHNFADNVEAELAKGASLENVRDVGAKAMENACRIAAVLAAFENLDCQEINEDCVTRGIKIADWYLNEAARLANSQVTDPNLQLAQRLLDWLQSQREKTFGIRDLLNRGPSPLRQKKILMPVLKELIDHNWITVVSERPKIFKLNSNS